MAKPTKEAQAALDAAGVSFYDLNGQMKPLPSIIEQVATATKGMTQQQRDNFLQTVFGVRGATAMNALLQTQSEEAKKTGRSWQDYYRQVTSGSTAAEQAKTRMDSLSGSLENLRGSLETAAVVAFTALLGPIKAVVDFVTEFFSSWSPYPRPSFAATKASG